MKKVALLEAKWARYKYLVLSKSPSLYFEIRELLNNKDHIDEIQIEYLIQKAIHLPDQVPYLINAFNHMFGYFKNCLPNSEKEYYLQKMSSFTLSDKQEMISLLRGWANQYHISYLQDSLILKNEEQ